MVYIISLLLICMYCVCVCVCVPTTLMKDREKEKRNGVEQRNVSFQEASQFFSNLKEKESCRVFQRKDNE